MCSAKNGNVEIRVESRLEQSVAQVFELDPRVRSYRAQPFTLDLSTGDLLSEKHLIKPQGTMYYTPDFSVLLDELQVVVEVKPRLFVEEQTEFLRLVRSALLSKGMRFIVISEDDFKGHYLRNVQLFIPYLTQASAALSQWAAPLQTLTPDRLKGPVRQILDTGLPANYQIAAGVLLGVVKFDLEIHQFELMDFEIAPAFGSLEAFEVIRYEL